MPIFLTAAERKSASFGAKGLRLDFGIRGAFLSCGEKFEFEAESLKYNQREAAFREGDENVPRRAW